MSKVSLDLKTEERLIKTAQKGGDKGREAFGQIYQHYQPVLARFFAAHLGGSSATEDLVSEVFKKALHGLDSFRWQDVSLSAWLYRISRNVLIDYYRESQKRRSVDLEDIAPPVSNEAGPEQNYAQSEQADFLHQLMSEFPKREQKIIYLKFFEGWTNKSIAGELDLSETNVGTIVYRVLARLRAKLLAHV